MTGTVRFILLACLGMTASGCISSRDAPNRLFKSPTTTPQEASEFRDYLLAAANSQGTYICKRPGADKSEPYPRRQFLGGRAEGVLADANPLPLRRFLDPDSTSRERDRFPWAKIGSKTYGYIVVFHPAVPEFPDPLNADSSGLVRTGMTVFDPSGIPFADGTATREVEFGGFGSAKSSNHEYSRCASIKVETDFTFGWWCKVRIRESMLVDRVLGIIERTEHISGSAMVVFSFESIRTYALVPPTESTEHSKPKTMSKIPKWSGLAVQMERIFHEPTIKGLVAEYEISNPDSTPPALARE